MYQYNSRCCYKEMPPTTEWNLNIFSPALYRELGKLFHKNSNACIYNKCMLYEMCTSIASAQSYNVCTGLCQGQILHNRIFLKTTVCLFPGWSAGKNNPDFILLLATFHYSNIHKCPRMFKRFKTFQYHLKILILEHKKVLPLPSAHV